MLRKKKKNSNVTVKVIFCLTLILCTSGLYAQFDMQGVIRPRFEYRDGYKKLRTENTKPAYFMSQRTRLTFNYKNRTLSTRITLYDARVWGDQVLKMDEPSMGLHEAWFELNLTESSKLKFGRQELNYDNSRLISRVNWNQIGAAHDAGLFKFR